MGVSFLLPSLYPGNRTQTVRLGSNPLSLRSHVAGSYLWVTGEYGNVAELYSIEQEKVISFPPFFFSSLVKVRYETLPWRISQAWNHSIISS